MRIKEPLEMAQLLTVVIIFIGLGWGVTEVVVSLAALMLER